MKISAIIAAAAISGVSSFAPSTASVHNSRGNTALNQISRDSNVDLGGNAWKPESEKMGVSMKHISYVVDDFMSNKIETLGFEKSV